MPHHSRLVIKCFHMGQGSRVHRKQKDQSMSDFCKCWQWQTLWSHSHSSSTHSSDEDTVLSSGWPHSQPNQTEPTDFSIDSNWISFTLFHTVHYYKLPPSQFDASENYMTIVKYCRTIFDDYKNMIFSQNMLSAITITGTIPRLLLFSRWAKMPCTLETTCQNTAGLSTH